MNKKWQIIKYLLADSLAAIFAIITVHKISNITVSYFLIPFWLLLYTATLTYSRIYYKSRLKELLNTSLVSFMGYLIIIILSLFFLETNRYDKFIQGVGIYVITHFAITALFRFILTTRTAYRIHKGRIGFNTLLIGAGQKALELYNDIQNQKKSTGNKFLGYLKLDNEENFLEAHLTKIEQQSNLHSYVEQQNIQEVIIAIDKKANNQIRTILDSLEGTKAVIKVIPDMYDILSGSVKMGAIFGTPLIEIYPDILSPWQQVFKRLFDVIVSLFFLLALSPIYLIVAFISFITLKGNIIFEQERIGKRGKPFNIYKFRSMCMNAEKGGPQLSSKADARVTPFGKILRKYRLDELPQFINVLKGEMSIIGPRPERQFYIDKIMEQAPHYYHLTKVRPGITSWGQVKYGYAETVEQMVDRLKFDIIYIENVSFLLDMKILFYTVVTVLKGKGK